MKVAFIGLGNMGAPMAGSLVRAGHEVVVYNRTRKKAEALEAEGAVVAASPADAANGCEAAFTMLSDDGAVESAVFGAEGVTVGLPRGAVHISGSTISTALARRLAAGHAGCGQGFLSAPVFGRPDAAAARKLVVVAGGPQESIDRCRPLFDAIGQRTYVAGPEPWQANAVKLCGNFMIASMIETFGEAFATLRKAGVDPHLFLETMISVFGSPVYANYGGMIAGEKYEPAGFAVRLGLKDVRLALQTAEEMASPMPVASLVRDHFVEAIAQGQAELDWSSLAKVAARNAGL